MKLKNRKLKMQKELVVVCCFVFCFPQYRINYGTNFKSMQLKTTDKQHQKKSNTQFEYKVSGIISIPEEMLGLLAWEFKLASANKGLAVGSGRVSLSCVLQPFFLALLKQLSDSKPWIRRTPALICKGNSYTALGRVPAAMDKLFVELCLYI